MPRTAYARAQEEGQVAVRTALLDIAGELLATEGPDALSMRRIATAAGCSTTVLYTMFGGKDGLVEALYIEGFDRFRRSLEAVPEQDDPLRYLLALGHAYRANALAERNYYGLMFGTPIPGFRPSPEALLSATRAFGHLERAVAACLGQGRLPRSDPRLLAESLWSIVHGAVSLELAGLLTDPDAVFATSVTAAVAGLPRGPHTDTSEEER